MPVQMCISGSIQEQVRYQLSTQILILLVLLGRLLSSVRLKMLKSQGVGGFLCISLWIADLYL